MSLHETLEQLHDDVAKKLLDKINSGDATAADFTAAINLLKHNKIECVPTPNNSLGRLVDKLGALPFPDPAHPA